MMSLTTKQAELLAFIKSYMAEHDGLAPNHDEMQEALGLASKSGVNRVLNGLEERGLIRRLYRRARAIEVLDDHGVGNTETLADTITDRLLRAKAFGTAMHRGRVRRIVLEALR